MVFKNFRFQVIARVVILALLMMLLAWCAVNGYYLRSAYIAVSVVILAAEFVWYVDRFNRDFKSFMIGLLQRDFTTHYQSKGKSRSYDELYQMLNRISEVFKAISAEKEIQHRFLEMLVDHLRVGILTLDESGKVHIVNRALKELLRKEVLFSIRSLESVDPSLGNTLLELRSGETRLIKLRVQNELLQLSIHASEFRLEDKYHKLISMQNIRNELDAREMEAWQKLIRVLTHEIMNSVSPVISLSETLHGVLRERREDIKPSGLDFYHTLEKGLDAIKVRSQGLYQFTQSYRKLTGIPQLSLQHTNVRDMMGRIGVLIGNQMKERGIAFKIPEVDIPLIADPDLMEHVLINLLLNAMEAVAATKDPCIELSAFRHDNGGVLISVRDNGEGMDEATAEKVFIPFFTTRRNGSGIGLAVTKQILQLHHADIRFTSEKGKGTEFVIVI